MVNEYFEFGIIIRACEGMLLFVNSGYNPADMD